MDINLLGPASRYAQRELGGIFVPRFDTVVVGTAVVVATTADPNCISLLFLNVGTTNITLGFEPGVVSGTGILLLGNGSSFSVNYKDDGDAPSFQFWAVGDAAAGSLFVARVVQAFKEASAKSP